jgi:hypothetical protein
MTVHAPPAGAPGRRQPPAPAGGLRSGRPGAPFPSRVSWTLLLLPWVLVWSLAACAGRTTSSPEAGYERGGVPSFRGERVLLFPPQLRAGGHPDLERELMWAMESRGAETQWVGPDALRRRVSESALRIDPDALAIQRFLVGEIQRIGDPLFGDLYRLAAVVSANYAVVPVQVRERMLDDGTRVVELAAAVIHPRSGRVHWYGIVEGRPGPPGDLAATVSATEALALRLLR